MPRYYSDPARESDPHALPDLEVWEANYCADERHESLCIHDEGTTCAACEDECNGRFATGWFYWFCFPGCLPDSDAFGPFFTEAAALADARQSVEPDDGSCPSCGANIGPCNDYPWHEADEDCRALHQPKKED